MLNILSVTCRLSLVTLLLGCTSVIETVNINNPTPDKIDIVELSDDVPTLSAAEIENEQWWLLFDSPTLHQVVEQALLTNRDIRLAQQRLIEVAAIYGVSQTESWPSVFARYNQSRNRATEAGNFPPFGQVVSDTSQMVLSTNWEIDLWGRLAALEKAQAARVFAEEYNYSAIRLSVSTIAASLMVNQQVQQLLLQLAESTLETSQALLDVEQKRFDAGLSNALQLRLVRAQYLNVLAQLPNIKEQVEMSKNALSVFLGSTVSDLPPLALEELVATPLQFIPEKTPSKLLLRRPDLAAASQQVLASKADLEAANKALFPRISLTGTYGSESAELSDLFTSPAKVWNVAASITQPIFQAGRLHYERDINVAKQNQAVIAYEKVIAEAFAEVHNILVAQGQAVKRLNTNTEQVENQLHLLDLANKRVQAGLAGQAELLNARLAVFSAQKNWVQAWAKHQNALFNAVKAIGGGFSFEPNMHSDN